MQRDIEDDGLNFNFWAAEIQVGGTTTVKLANGSDALHLTMACFGEDVKENSRTVLVCKCNEREAPIAVLLEATNENQHLDLMISGNTVCEFSLKGRFPSSVFLSGFLQPLVDAEDLGNITEAPKQEVEEPDETEETNSSIGSKRQLAAPDRPKKKAKSESILPREGDNSMDMLDSNKDTDVSKQQTESKPAIASPQSSEPDRDRDDQSKKKKKKKSKFTYDETGLGIRTVKKGTGPAVKDGDTVRIRYIGQLAGKKSIFDKNLADGFTFTLGEGTVVKGLNQGLMAMQKDEKRKLIIPSALAYGSEGHGDEIPADSDLLFTVELLEII